MQWDFRRSLVTPSACRRTRFSRFCPEDQSYRRSGRSGSRNQRSAGHPGVSAVGEVRCSGNHHCQRRSMGEGRDAARATHVGDLDHADVPVYQGAEFPLINSKEESERWEAMYGKFEYKGCWTDKFEANRSTVYDEAVSRSRCRSSHEGGSSRIQGASGNCRGVYRADGAQVSAARLCCGRAVR